MIAAEAPMAQLFRTIREYTICLPKNLTEENVKTLQKAAQEFLVKNNWKNDKVDLEAGTTGYGNHNVWYLRIRSELDMSAFVAGGVSMMGGTIESEVTG
jgi:hypothetical protein